MSRLPLNEVVYDFYDRLKSYSRGYASFDYQLDGYADSDLVKLSVLINKHLFRYKYDYRNEWLRLINYLAQPAEAPAAHVTVKTEIVVIGAGLGGLAAAIRTLLVK